MTIRNVCEKYFNLILHPTTRHDKKGKALTAAAILSCFTLIVPAGFGAVYGIAKLAAKIKKGNNTTTELKTSTVAVSILPSPTPKASSSSTSSKTSESEIRTPSKASESEENPPPAIKSLEERKDELIRQLWNPYIFRTQLTEENREALTALAQDKYRLTLSLLLKVMKSMEKPSENPLLVDLIALRIGDLSNWSDKEDILQLASLLFVLPKETQIAFLKLETCLKCLTEEQKTAIAEMPAEAFLPKAVLTAVLSLSWTEYSSKDFEWVKTLPDAVWEATVAECSHNTYRKFHDYFEGNRLTKAFPEKQLSILRSMLKNPHANATIDFGILSDVRSRLNTDHPTQLLREIGTENLLHFPWDEYIVREWKKLPPKFMSVMLHHLNMENEEDISILKIMARSPLLSDRNYKIGFFQSLNPRQREMLKLEEVHEALKLPLELLRMPIQELYEAFNSNQSDFVNSYKEFGRPRFTELFTYACQNPVAPVPEALAAAAKEHFKRSPNALAELTTGDLILQAGRLLQEDLIPLTKRLLTDFRGEPIEKIRALEQLLAEKQVLIKDDTFDFYKQNSTAAFYSYTLRQLAEKLDDPFLLMPILSTNGQPLPSCGPLGGNWSAQLWHHQPRQTFGLYTDLMEILEKAPWKFALMLEDRIIFDTSSFNNWLNHRDTSKPADLEVPILQDWNTWLNVEEEKERREIHDALGTAVKDKNYDSAKALLESSPKAKQIFTAAILGPTPETVAHRIRDYSEKQVLAALSTEEGKQRLAPHFIGLMSNANLSLEFKDWIAILYKFPKDPNREAHFNNEQSDPKPDLTLKVGETTLRLHKDILSDSSGWFKSKFSVNPNAQEMELPLPDGFNPNAIEPVLHYFYSRELPEFENVDSLVAFSEVFNYLK